MVGLNSPRLACDECVSTHISSPFYTHLSSFLLHLLAVVSSFKCWHSLGPSPIPVSPVPLLISLSDLIHSHDFKS